MFVTVQQLFLDDIWLSISTISLKVAPTLWLSSLVI